MSNDELPHQGASAARILYSQRFLLVLVVLFAGFRTGEVSAQCDVTAALDRVRQSGCLSEVYEVALRNYLVGSVVKEDEKKRALEAVTDAYGCLLHLDEDEAIRVYRCFRQTLQEKFYASFKDEELCLRDRLIRACVALRYALDKKLPSSEPLQHDQIIDKALNDFRLGFGVCRQIQLTPHAFASTDLAGKWCVDINNPVPSPAYVNELVDLSVQICAQYPQLGQHLGTLLDAILSDALALYQGTKTEETLRKDYALLIKFDNADLSGTSFIYLFEKKLAQALPRPEVLTLSEVGPLLQNLEKLRPDLDEGARRFRRKSESWRPFERYSDLLYDLAKPLKSRAEQWETRDNLLRASCEALWKGIELSLSGETAGQLTKVREKLVDRIRTYGIELARELKYGNLVNFEKRFLDESGRILLKDQQCYIHAHLAQAYYVLGYTKEPWEHLNRSCGLVSASDLERLRKGLEPWLKQSVLLIPQKARR